MARVRQRRASQQRSLASDNNVPDARSLATRLTVIKRRVAVPSGQTDVPSAYPCTCEPSLVNQRHKVVPNPGADIRAPESISAGRGDAWVSDCLGLVTIMRWSTEERLSNQINSKIVQCICNNVYVNRTCAVDSICSERG